MKNKQRRICFFIVWVVSAFFLLMPGQNKLQAGGLSGFYGRLCQEHGLITHGSRKISPRGIALTVDMCPSTKPWNRPLFERLVALGEKLGGPLPVAVCVSGRWMTRYPDAVAQLLRWDSGKRLVISWVNHSDTHPVKGGFLVNPKVDFTGEVQKQAVRMKKSGTWNTPLFRFPGLVYNQHRLIALNKMGYVALGADAWLAKGQRVRNGSIILVHGNGNERFGVRLLFKYLDRHREALQQGTLRFLSLKKLFLESIEVDPGLQFISWTHPKSR